MFSHKPFRLLIAAVASTALAVAVPVAALASAKHMGHANGKAGHQGHSHTMGSKGQAGHMMGSKGKAGSHRDHSKDHKGSTGSRDMREGMMVLDQSLAPSMPEDPTLHGVMPGAKPWVMRKGEVRLKADGKLTVHIKGLIIPKLGNAGPVKMVSAALYCGTSTEAAAMSPEVPLTAKGDAKISEKSFKVPASCLAPTVLVETKGPEGMSMYIAAGGW